MSYWNISACAALARLKDFKLNLLHRSMISGAKLTFLIYQDRQKLYLIVSLTTSKQYERIPEYF